MSERSCVVIPCFNEAERLDSEAFLYFLGTVSDIDFCFVNDGSRDGTGALLEKICRLEPGRIFVVDYADNRGKAEAVRSGMNYALNQNRYEWVGYADADLATPLEEVQRLLEVLRKRPAHLIVMGSRIKRMGVRIERKLFRHYMGRLFATLVSVLFHFNAYDTQCGAKFFDKKIARIVFERPFISGWLFDVEILLRVRNQCPDYNQIVREVPLNVWLEQGGSKIKISHLMKIPAELWRMYFEYKS